MYNSPKNCNKINIDGFENRHFSTIMTQNTDWDIDSDSETPQIQKLNQNTTDPWDNDEGHIDKRLCWAPRK